MLEAQTSPAPSAASVPAQKPANARKDFKAAHPAAQPEPLPIPTSPAPVAPNWPVNDPAKDASVVWDSHGLLVVASNSSLDQILKEISVDTGVKVEGLSKDERIFGTYGPAPARNVLFQLLDGSSYNVLMIGDQGQGTPRRVVLSVRTGGAPSPGNVNPSQPNDEDNGAEEISQQPQPEEPPPPPQAPPAPNGYTPGVPVRTQQQMIEEMQERQRQLEQQRQQQQQQNPQN